MSPTDGASVDDSVNGALDDLGPVGGTTAVTEFGIEWTAPADMAGTITPVDSEERARRLLRIQARLPGDQAGRMVVRHVFYTPYRPVDDIRTILAREADEIEANMDTEEDT